MLFQTWCLVSCVALLRSIIPLTQLWSVPAPELRSPVTSVAWEDSVVDKTVEKDSVVTCGTAWCTCNTCIMVWRHVTNNEWHLQVTHLSDHVLSGARLQSWCVSMFECLCHLMNDQCPVSSVSSLSFIQNKQCFLQSHNKPLFPS